MEAALRVKAASDTAGKRLSWKGHSMGCYLLLNMVDRLRWKGEDMKALFGSVILDAPDVPTWFFRAMAKVRAQGDTRAHVQIVWFLVEYATNFQRIFGEFSEIFLRNLKGFSEIFLRNLEENSARDDCGLIL